MTQSPAPPGDGDLMQHGLQQLIQHNASTPYPQEQYDEGLRLRQSSYRSPTPGDGYVFRGQQQQQQQQQYYQHPQHQHDGRMGIPYDYRGAVYGDQYSSPGTSPSTPSMNSRDLRRTRNGIGHQRSQHLRSMPDDRSRNTSSPKPKRQPKKVKVKAEKKVAKLDKPLSELTKDWTHVAVVDIDSYVNRSAEVRRREVEEGKIPGKVKRPMNSFMLYRKAYQNRTKDWCLQNNHQVVSQVCGDSWPLEPDEVKEQFNEWARIERLNHQNAHPGYKFSPTKPGQGKAVKRKMSEEPVSEQSDLEDFEWQGPKDRKRAYRSPNSRGAGQPTTAMYPTTRSAYDYRDSSAEPYLSSHDRSLFHNSNPGVPLPAPYDQAGLRPGQYYQQTIQQHPRIQGAEDVFIRKQDTPGSFLGLPGGNEHMMNQYPQYDPRQMGQRLDPALMGQEQMYDHMQYPDSMGQQMHFGDGQHMDQQWAPSYGMTANSLMPFIDPELTGDGGQIQDPHMHVLKGNNEGWQVEPLDAGGEFEKWMNEEQH